MSSNFDIDFDNYKQPNRLGQDESVFSVAELIQSSHVTVVYGDILFTNFYK